MKTALPLLLVASLAGCATAPAPLRGEFAAISPEQAQEGASASSVRWGGTIIRTEPGAEQTCIEILGRELSESARPRPTPDRSAGRFLACRAGFYDPAIFAEEREVTVTGRVIGVETRRIGEYDYRYPRIAADVIYLWPERRQVDPGYWHRYDPFWPSHGSFWWGRPYYHHPRVPLKSAAQPAKGTSGD
jgi:outer membrane lipoprotein